MCKKIGDIIMTALERAVAKKRQQELKAMQQEAMEIVIKRSGVSKKSIVDGAMKLFFVDNMDLLTPAEMKKYKPIIL